MTSLDKIPKEVMETVCIRLTLADVSTFNKIVRDLGFTKEYYKSFTENNVCTIEKTTSLINLYKCTLTGTVENIYDVLIKNEQNETAFYLKHYISKG